MLLLSPSLWMGEERREKKERKKGWGKGSNGFKLPFPLVSWKKISYLFITIGADNLNGEREGDWKRKDWLQGLIDFP
jgi:hypothetical protein